MDSLIPDLRYLVDLVISHQLHEVPIELTIAIVGDSGRWIYRAGESELEEVGHLPLTHGIVIEVSDVCRSHQRIK